jgi:hypothetical protein
MDNQGTRDDFAGRAQPVGTFAGAASPHEATAVGDPLDVAPGLGDAPGETTGQPESGASGAMAKMDAGIEKAAGGIDKLVDAIRDKGQDLGQSSGATGTVGSVATAAADRLEGASQYLHQTDADRLMTDLEALIRRKPVESLLVAAGLGFVVAKALR